MAPIFTMDDIRRANYRAGYHFFDHDTLRFFRSRVGDTVYQGVGGIFFITSECNPSGVRAYTVRQFNPDSGRIATMGPFHSFTRTQAIATAKRLSLGGAL